MEQLMHACVQWTTLLVPALAAWAIVAVSVYRTPTLAVLVDTCYFAVMLLVGALTWRIMSSNEAGWLIHTATLGTMIVFGVLPKRERLDEAVNWLN